MDKNTEKKGQGMKESKELVTVDTERYPIMDSQKNIGEIIAENLEGDMITVSDLPRIKVPSGGGLAWSVPGPDGQDTAEKTIHGVIIHHQQTRAYYKEAFAGGKTPPDCYSDDTITGHGDNRPRPQPGENQEEAPLLETSRYCATCPQNQFGSMMNNAGQKTTAKACKTRRQIFIATEGSLLPTSISCPPTSLKASRAYFVELASQQLRISEVVTAFSLKKSKSGDNIDYSEIVFRNASKLTPEQAAAVANYAKKIKPFLSNFIKETAATETE